jgi:hypothetical protein
MANMMSINEKRPEKNKIQFLRVRPDCKLTRQSQVLSPYFVLKAGIFF